jgi:hypothetical protein
MSVRKSNQYRRMYRVSQYSYGLLPYLKKEQLKLRHLLFLKMKLMYKKRKRGGPFTSLIQSRFTKWQKSLAL